MTTKQLEFYKDEFVDEVDSHADYIDPFGDHDWYDLTLGWALGKGMNVNDALDFASYIRYRTDLG